MFAPVVLPETMLRRLHDVSMADMIFFHRSEGNILFSATTRRIYREIRFGQSIYDFMEWMRRSVYDSEQHHLETFLGRIERGEGDLADSFRFAQSVIPDETAYAIKFMEFDAGSLVLLIPHESSLDIDDKIIRAESWKTSETVQAINDWCREIEMDYLVSVFLRQTAEEGLRSVVFSRPTVHPISGDAVSLVYRRRGHAWFRDFAPFVPLDGERKRHTARRTDSGDIVVDCSVFLGGVSRIGVASIPLDGWRDFASIDRFVRHMSTFLCQESATLSGISFPYSRYWTGRGFDISSLPSIAQRISPSGYDRLDILPFEIPEPRERYRTERDLDRINLHLYTSDVLFVSQSLDRGAILLSHIGEEKASFVRHKIQKGLESITIHAPMTAGRYLSGERGGFPPLLPNFQNKN